MRLAAPALASSYEARPRPDGRSIASIAPRREPPRAAVEALESQWEEKTGVRARPARLQGVQLDFPLLHYVDAQMSLGSLEGEYVAWALLGERGNRSATARRLNLTRTTFLRHLKRLGLEDLIPEEELRQARAG
ncbi:MAG: hypothetical protein HYY06_27155 [Deltaproteobacteria bacterium]|nr:hypothetical protein [Deltaproteobacteria bacterium]